MRHALTLADPSFIFNSSPAGRVADWAIRCQKNGAVSSPSAATIATMVTFYTALDAANLIPKFRALNCFVPDSLIATLTPLIIGSGLDPWTNHNFVAGDLISNGLKGANTKYLEIGVNPSTDLSTNSAGVTTYWRGVVPGEATVDFGCDDGTNFFVYQHKYSDDRHYWDCWNQTNDNGRLWVAVDIDGWGYFSANRTAADKSTLYEARSNVSFRAMKTVTGTTIGTPPNYPVFLFTVNSSGTPDTRYSTKTLSFTAVHDGLTHTEAFNLYSAVQALQVAFGRSV